MNTLQALHTEGTQIVDEAGAEVRLRGPGIASPNFENFIQGYPGTRSELVEEFERQLGPDTAELVMDTWADQYFGPDDADELQAMGCNTVRLAMNYHTLEDDRNPRVLRQDGLEKLDRDIDICRAAGLYAVLDMHAVPGGQNPDWHSDNRTHVPQLWGNRDFQERHIWLWQELADRYKGDPAVAGYDIMNEPATRPPYGKPNFDALNAMQTETVAAIREIDPDHIIFLEGDDCASNFEGLDPPNVDNLVISLHDYAQPCTMRGAFPGVFNGKFRDAAVMKDTFTRMSGYQLARDRNLPLWVGEFGAPHGVPAHQVPYRMAALSAQMQAMEDLGASWSIWNSKDVGVMGMYTVRPDSPYMQLVGDVLDKKAWLGGDQWIEWNAEVRTSKATRDLSELMVGVAQPDDDGFTARRSRHLLRQAVVDHAARLLLPQFVSTFKGLDEGEIRDVFSSFHIDNCDPSPVQRVVRNVLENV